MRRHALACLTATMAEHGLTELLKRHAMAPHFDEGTHDGAHHVAKEAVGRDLEAPLCRRQLVPLGMGEPAECGLHVGTGLAECGKVLLRQQPLGSLVHEREIELVVGFPGIMAKEGVFSGMQIVMVRARSGAETRVHVGSHCLDALHGDVGGQDAVEPVGQLLSVGGEVGGEGNLRMVEVGHHHACVDTGIGTTCSDHLYRLPEQCGERLLEPLLNGDAVGLNLPAVIGSAVERKGDEKPLHDAISSAAVWPCGGRPGDGTSPRHGES